MKIAEMLLAILILALIIVLVAPSFLQVKEQPTQSMCNNDCRVAQGTMVRFLDLGYEKKCICLVGSEIKSIW